MYSFDTLKMLKNKRGIFKKLKTKKLKKRR